MKKESNIEFVKNIKTNPWFKRLVWTIVNKKCVWCKYKLKPEDRIWDILLHFHTTHGFHKDLFYPIKKAPLSDAFPQ